MFTQKKIKAIHLDEMIKLVDYCRRTYIFMFREKRPNEFFGQNCYIEDHETIFKLTVKIADEPCTYVCRKDNEDIIFGATGLEAYSIVQKYYKAKDFRNDEFVKRELGYDPIVKNSFSVSASPFLYHNKKFEGTRQKAIGYDLNSSYSNAMLGQIPNTDVPYRIGVVKENEVGFIDDEGQLIPVFEGSHSHFIFPLMESPYKKFVEKYYSIKKNAKTPEEKKRAKDILNFSIGYMQKTNPFIRAMIIYRANKLIKDLIDENTLYCNTDSIVCLKPRDEIKIGKEIGDFKVEHEGEFAFVGFNYQWDLNTPAIRRIQKSAFKEGWDILKDPFPTTGSGNIAKFNYKTFRLERY